MKGKVLTQNAIDDFAAYLKNEEKGENTIQKYIHDIQDFMRFANYLEITKGMVIEYKNKLISENYAIRSINSMLAALNSLFTFLEWEDFKVKSIKLQQQVYCSEEKELTKDSRWCSSRCR